MGLSAGVPPTLELVSVTKSFRTGNFAERRALDQIDLAIWPGQVVAVVGPSGSGKSTLLRLCAGLDQPSSGRVLSDGQEVQGTSRRRGCVFQDYGFFPWLSVRQNVEFGLRGFVPDSEVRARVARWLHATGLADVTDLFPKALSGGMRQRLAMARALAVEPSLLLADEPFGALDDPTRRSMRGILREATSEIGCTVLFVTHDVREAITLGERIIMLSASPGRIIREWTRPGPQAEAETVVERMSWFSDLYDEILATFPHQLGKPVQT